MPQQGIDLHSVVRTAITALHPDEPCLWYRSKGQENVRGKIVPVYAAPVSLAAQIQSDSDEKLYFSNRAGENEVTRVFYLFAERAARVAGIIRPEARNGDFLRREADGSWWLVTGVLEDFSLVDWEKVRAVLQTKAPDLSLSDAADSGDGGDEGAGDGTDAGNRDGGH